MQPPDVSLGMLAALDVIHTARKAPGPMNLLEFLQCVDRSPSGDDIGVDVRSRFRSDHFRFHVGYVLVVLFLSSLFGYFVIRHFNGPVYGTGDEALWGDNAWYVGKHLRLFPFPSFQFHNDEAFYPYGTVQVFAPWCLERDLIVSSLTRGMGFGPWIQLYYLGTLLVIALGSYLLLTKAYGRWIAAGAGLLLAFANYYAVAKFPHHTNIACVHWTTLNILADQVLLYRFWTGRGWSARLLAARAALLVLALGQDLGYVAAYALTSFTLVLGFVTITDAWRRRRLWFHPAGRIRGWWVALGQSAREHRHQVEILACLCLVAGFVYIPTVLQIGLTARSLGHMEQGESSSSPLRLLVPIVPHLLVGNHLKFLNDVPERGFFSMIPGFFFVFTALLGLLLARENRAMAVPWLLLLVLFLFHRQNECPLLKAFPWQVYSRVSGRATITFPVLLTILALPFYSLLQERLHSMKWRVILLFMLLILAVEFTTAYSLVIGHKKDWSPPNARYLRLMKQVRLSPGEAVLDWPFIVTSGNGVTFSKKANVYRRKLGGVGAQRQFHGKKVVGYRFGRLHRNQVTPFVRAGWDEMFFPNHTEKGRKKRRRGHLEVKQKRDFTEKEWAFFEKFYVLNDFCGMLIYPDLLPRRTLVGIHRRFGKPSAVAELPGLGRIQFIPKPLELRQQVDETKGRSLSLLDQVGSGGR